MWNFLILFMGLFGDVFGQLLKTLMGWLTGSILIICLVLVPLAGCQSDGPGWKFRVIVPNGFEVGYENLEHIAGRTYKHVQTFHAEGLNLLTGAIQNLRTDPNVELTEEQAAYVAGLEAEIEARRGEVAALEAEVKRLGDESAAATEAAAGG